MAQTSLSSQDKKLTILTADLGLVEAVSRNPVGMRSKLSASSEVLAYSDFCLYKGKSGYIINSADLENNFYKLREDLLSLSLAGYFCELTRFIIPTEDNGKEVLSLILNTLYLLEHKKRSPKLLKAIFELKLLSLSGFMPNVTSCSICGCEESEKMYFIPAEGRLICEKCLEQSSYNGIKIILPMAVKKAMEYILFSNIKQVFSFKLNDESEMLFADIAEKFALYHIGGNFKSLEFYKSI